MSDVMRAKVAAISFSINPSLIDCFNRSWRATIVRVLFSATSDESWIFASYSRDDFCYADKKEVLPIALRTTEMITCLLRWSRETLKTLFVERSSWDAILIGYTHFINSITTNQTLTINFQVIDIFAFETNFTFINKELTCHSGVEKIILYFCLWVRMVDEIDVLSLQGTI